LKRKALIIGLDGATFDLIRPWVHSGELPTFARLMREGSYGELRSVLPPLTAPAWTTMVTGTNPGKHGLVDFWARDFTSYDFRLLNSSSRARPCLWDIVSQAGGQVIVLNVPMTYPPTPVNGVMVSGMDTPGLDTQYTYPPEVKHELNEAVGKYVIVPDDWLYSRRRQYDRARQEILNGIETQFAAANHLLEHHPWHLAMVVFTAPDGAAHFFWKFMDPEHLLYEPDGAARYGQTILEVYKNLDAKLDAFLASLPQDTFLFIVSDHGNGRVSDRAIYLNAWLEQKGLLCYRRGSLGQRWKRLFSQTTLRMLRSVRRQMRSYIPYQVQAKLEALLPGGGKRIESSLTSMQIDWFKTKAFSDEVRGSIWINLRGRDAQGIVSPGVEYESLRERIIAEVPELRDPRTGEELIERVYRREELYHGPHAHSTPDIILEPKDTMQIFRKKEGARKAIPVRILSAAEASSADTTGHHLMNGVFLIHGPAVRANNELTGMQMRDVAPTVLYAVGLPVPEWMDGKVSLDAFEPAHVAQHPVQRAGEAEQEAGEPQDQVHYLEEEARLIEDRLRGLGYM
jgi:predicted AlkP superfamily phosphohydrolase/phosphomutase